MGLPRRPHAQSEVLPASLQLARYLVEQHHGADALVVLRRAEAQGAAPAALLIALGRRCWLREMQSRARARSGRPWPPIPGTRPPPRSGRRSNRWAARGGPRRASALSTKGGVKGLGSRVAAILIKLGRKDEALVVYQTEIAAGGAAPLTKVAAARLAIELGRKDVARAFAESAVTDDPRTPGALLVLADVRRAEGDLGSALSELRRALAVDGSAEVQLEYGRALAALGRDEEALSALAQAREIPEAAVERGRILLRRGDVDAAAKELTTATTSLPTHAEAFLLLGQAEDRQGHVTRAEAAWKSAVRLAPTSAESRYRWVDCRWITARQARPPTCARQPNGSARWAGHRRRGVPICFPARFAELHQGLAIAPGGLQTYLEVAPRMPRRVEVTRKSRDRPVTSLRRPSTTPGFPPWLASERRCVAGDPAARARAVDRASGWSRARCCLARGQRAPPALGAPPRQALGRWPTPTRRIGAETATPGQPAAGPPTDLDGAVELDARAPRWPPSDRPISVMALR